MSTSLQAKDVASSHLGKRQFLCVTENIGGGVGVGVGVVVVVVAIRR
jgi:hypothetical protein